MCRGSKIGAPLGGIKLGGANRLHVPVIAGQERGIRQPDGHDGGISGPRGDPRLLRWTGRQPFGRPPGHGLGESREARYQVQAANTQRLTAGRRIHAGQGEAQRGQPR